jgi:hypothetical protein
MASRSSSVWASRSVPLTRLTRIVALPEAVPRNDCCAAVSVSLLPAREVWYVSTSGSSSMIASASRVRARVASSVVPGGGVMVTERTSSEPALRKAVGICGMSVTEATNRSAAAASVTQRKRRASWRTGV